MSIIVYHCILVSFKYFFLDSLLQAMRSGIFTIILSEDIRVLFKVESHLSSLEQACIQGGFFWVYGDIFKESFIKKLNNNQPEAKLLPTVKVFKSSFGKKNIHLLQREKGSSFTIIYNPERHKLLRIWKNLSGGGKKASSTIFPRHCSSQIPFI